MLWLLSNLGICVYLYLNLIPYRGAYRFFGEMVSFTMITNVVQCALFCHKGINISKYFAFCFHLGPFAGFSLTGQCINDEVVKG